MCHQGFQSAYQKTISPAQFKAEDIQLAPSLDSNIVLYLVAILNSRHYQCFFSDLHGRKAPGQLDL